MQLQLAIFILLTICGIDNKEGPLGREREKKVFISNALKNVEQRDMKLEVCRAVREGKSNPRPLHFSLVVFFFFLYIYITMHKIFLNFSLRIH